MDLVKVLSEQQLKSDLPTLKIGDTVKVHAKIKRATASVFRYSKASSLLRSTLA